MSRFWNRVRETWRRASQEDEVEALNLRIEANRQKREKLRQESIDIQRRLETLQGRKS